MVFDIYRKNNTKVRKTFIFGLKVTNCQSKISIFIFSKIFIFGWNLTWFPIFGSFILKLKWYHWNYRDIKNIETEIFNLLNFVSWQRDIERADKLAAEGWVLKFWLIKSVCYIEYSNIRALRFKYAQRNIDLDWINCHSNTFTLTHIAAHSS